MWKAIDRGILNGDIKYGKWRLPGVISGKIWKIETMGNNAVEIKMKIAENVNWGC